MTFDSREIAHEWAWSKGWSVELSGTTITVRDGDEYVMAELDLCHVQPAALRMAVNDLEFQKSVIHVAVHCCGLTSKALHWTQRRRRPQ